MDREVEAGTQKFSTGVQRVRDNSDIPIGGKRDLRVQETLVLLSQSTISAMTVPLGTKIIPADHKLESLISNRTPRLSRPPRIARQERSLEESLALLKDLDAPATEIKGIGSKIAGVLEQLDLFTIRDLLYNLPRDYHDYTELQCIRELTPGNISTVIATVAHTSIVIG